MDEFRSGYGAPWLDFLVTLHGRYREVREELLADPAALRAFLAQHDLSPTQVPGLADLERARALREALHALTRAAHGGTAPPSAALREVERALAADQPLRLRRSGNGVRAQRPETAAEALARLARAAIDDLSRAPAPPLRACGDDTCSAFYLDPTGRRRWCSDQRCGNKARVRAHRARQRET